MTTTRVADQHPNSLPSWPAKIRYSVISTRHTKLQEINVFDSVCHSVRQRGSTPQGPLFIDLAGTIPTPQTINPPLAASDS